MAFSKKKPDPISDRARALNQQIAALESEIKKLDTQIQRAPTPKLRSTARPHGVSVPHSAEPPPPAPKPAANEPVFESVNQTPLQTRPESESPEHFNEHGVRKYDLPALWGRLRNHFRGPTSNNPRLVNYLAAGGVHGLRPMRYEKRVARNRFITLVVVLFLILLGVISLFVKNH
jgi:cell division protein FtsB